MEWTVEALKTDGRWPVRPLGNKGFSLIELMAAVAVVALLIGVAAPSFLTMIQGNQVDAGTRRLLADVHRARSQAITTGWEVKILGFNAGAGNGFANQYRLLARANNLTAWLPDLAAPTTPPLTPTQIAGQWVNMNNEYRGVSLNVGDPSPRFWVTFNARGIRIDQDNSFQNMTISDGSGTVTRSMSVSLPGIVTIQ